MGNSSINTTSPPLATTTSSTNTAMSTTVNLVMTTFGFLVSAVFIIFVLVRLLCARFQTRRSVPEWARGASLNPGEEHGANGIDPLLITLFPTIKFSGELFASQENATCAVCLGEYEDRDSLRILPQCGHTFHENCIDAWLRQHSTCPVCRIHLQNSPTRRNMASPLLSEVARSRFTPGALPESLFEKPLFDLNSPVLDPGPHRQLTPRAGHEHSAHVIQLLETKEGSDVAVQTLMSSSRIQGSFEVCVATNGISSTERMTSTGQADNVHACMPMQSNGFPEASCSVDDDFANRSSFSSWIRRSQGNSILGCASESVASGN